MSDYCPNCGEIHSGECAGDTLEGLKKLKGQEVAAFQELVAKVGKGPPQHPPTRDAIAAGLLVAIIQSPSMVSALQVAGAIEAEDGGDVYEKMLDSLADTAVDLADRLRARLAK